MEITTLIESFALSQHKITLNVHESVEQEGTPFLQTLYVLSGTGVLEFNSQTYDIKIGFFQVILSNTSFTIKNTGGGLLNIFLTQSAPA